MLRDHNTQLSPRTRNAVLISIIVIITLMPAHGPAQTSGEQQTETPDVGWAVSEMKRVVGGRKVARGHMIYTTDAQNPGAIFRCYQGKLYAILSVQATNLENVLMYRNHKPPARKIGVTVGSRPEKLEDWGMMDRGRRYIAHSISTTVELFSAAKEGSTVVVRPNARSYTKINLPAISNKKLDSFLAECQLNQEYLGFAR